MKKILVIEDEQYLRDTIKDTLELYEYKVHTAQNGEEGVKFALEILPDLIICDIMMPYKNGFEVARELKAFEESKLIPFIFLSAKTEPRDFREGLEIGVDDYLIKPFKTKDLIHAIEMRLQMREDLSTVANKFEGSVTSGEKVQKLILPSLKTLYKYFNEHFCLYRPKKIVSGDFYWVKQFDNCTYAAVIDCTGHGVQGALLSMLFYEMLESLVDGEKEPSRILEELNKQVYKFMTNKSDSTTPMHGLDIGICKLDPINKVVYYSGSHIGLFYRKDGKQKVTEIPGDKNFLGSVNPDVLYNNHVINYQSEIQLFLSTDGFTDQFGKVSRKKMGKKRWVEILSSVPPQNFNEIEKELTTALSEWQLNEEQTDDILVLGIKM